MENKAGQEYLDQYGLEKFKALCYTLSREYRHAFVLDSCELNSGIYAGRYEFIAAYGNQENLSGDQLEALQSHIGREWIFTVLGYDLKNKFEKLESKHKAAPLCPDLYFIVPELLICIDKAGKVDFKRGNLPSHFFQQKNKPNSKYVVSRKSVINKQHYIQNIEKIQDLIREGEVYELNYCEQQLCHFEDFDPQHFQLALLRNSPVPMASFVKMEDLYLCGASMERYLAKSDRRILSQPIKGTMSRSANIEEDEVLKNKLHNSIKEQAENVMIVDLVRNDLARICETGSIKVTELFGIHSYPQVHQMISTIEGYLRSDIHFEDILRATFPMGSMTGTPKIAAMQRIEQLEDFRRAWYSGAVGYINPEGDFDFNVVIRSLICDLKSKILSFSAGGAITIDSDPEQEWEECRLKSGAIERLLSELAVFD